MKKVGLTFAVLLLLVTGCGKPELTAKERIEKATTAVQTYDNLNMKMDVSVNVNANGMSMDMNVSGSGVVDRKNKTTHMNMTSKVLGMTIESETYTESKNGKLTTYTKEKSEWKKEVKDDTSSTGGMADFSSLKDASKIEEIKESDKNIHHYQVTLTPEEAKKMMSGNTDNSLTQNISGDVIVDIYINQNNELSKVSMTMKNKADSGEQKVTLSYEISNINSAGTVTIPNDVIENAILDTDDDSDFGDDYE